MAVGRIKLENFTAFRELELIPSPGINVLVGANATGKTHLLKVAYAACDRGGDEESFVDSLRRVFRPHGDDVGRLVNHAAADGTASVSVELPGGEVSARLNAGDPQYREPGVGPLRWGTPPVAATYSPPEEMLAHAPGFRSLVRLRELEFEAVYADIVDRAYLPPLRELSPAQAQAAKAVEEALCGTVETHGEEFFLTNSHGSLEFMLVAEGLRKLALLWLLIRNGSLAPGSVLFWDEPEANLNPKMIGPLINVLLMLQRDGLQVFLATHDYVVLKELELQRSDGDEILYHALYQDGETGDIRCSPSDDLTGLHPNAITETFADLYDRDVRRVLGG
ncbi:MAG TPA: AAA family ATPase [Armatimonadetes bacterium]|nr:AAA family ATPase [Armatimonadota bacterium]